MQSTIQPPAPSPPAAEFLTGYTLRIHRAQSDALDILHRVMIQAARLLEDPPLEKPYQTRATNERMRIAMRTAATIINMRHPKAPPASPPPSPTKPGRVDRAAPEEPEDKQSDLKDGFLNIEAPRARMSVLCSTPTAATTLITSAASNPLTTAEPAIPSPVSSPLPLSTHDSALTTSPFPLPSSAPSVTSVVNGLSSSSSSSSPLPSSVPPVPSVVKCLPPPPPDLTFEERANIYMRQQGVKVPDMHSISCKLRAWHLYTEATGIKPPFDNTPEAFLPPRRPRKRKRNSPRTPLSTQDSAPKTPIEALSPPPLRIPAPPPRDSSPTAHQSTPTDSS